MIGDFFIVVRYFVISVVFVGLLQVEIKGKTLENQATGWFYSSSVPQHIRTAAKGGALAIENGANSAKRFFKSTFTSNSSNAVERASR